MDLCVTPAGAIMNTHTHTRYPNLDGLQVDFAWLVRGFEQNAFERGYLQAELLTPSASDAFKAGVWGQLFLVGFNIARYVGLDWARKLAPPGARFLDRVVGLVVGFVCGLALLVQPALQLALYSVALRFQLARTSRFPLTAVDVAPEVFLVRWVGCCCAIRSWSILHASRCLA